MNLVEKYAEKDLLNDVTDQLTKMALASLFEESNKFLDESIEKRSIVVNNFNLIMKDLYLNKGERNFKKVYAVLHNWVNNQNLDMVINDKDNVLTDEMVVTNFLYFYNDEFIF